MSDRQSDHPASGGFDRRLRVIAGSDADAAGVLRLLDTTRVRVILDNGVPQWRHQILATALVDLLGRLFPVIEIECDADAPSDAALPPGPPLLRDRLRGVAAHGALKAPSDPPATLITVVIGAGLLSKSDDEIVLYADGGGWQSFNGRSPSQLPDVSWAAVPVGPLAAACRAAGQVTGVALRPFAECPLPAESAYASALRHEVSETPIDEGVDGSARAWAEPTLDAILAGAGSIGGALVYALAATPALRGRLIITDPQRLEDQNLDRALLATAADTSAMAWKADVADAALAHHVNLTVDAHHTKLKDWVASHPTPIALPLVLTAVDSLAERRAIQDSLPLELLNAACHPDEVTISGHRTGEGPCVCCLHMAQVLDARSIRVRLVSQATGLNERMVAAHLSGYIPMPPEMVRQIERFRGVTPGALARYEGLTLEDLHRGALLYGSTAVNAGNSTIAVAAPYVTALAGVLLAAECLKASVPALVSSRLGPAGPAIKYEENRLGGPLYRLLTNPPRWNGAECLCRSARRQRILQDRYGRLQIAQAPAD